MANYSKIFNHEPYSCIPTAIGDIYVFSITVGSQIELHKELGKPINKCEPIDFVKKLIRHICFLKVSLKEGKYKPAEPLLTNDDISSLTEDDIEAIAKLYIEHNDYLFKKSQWKTKQNDKGETANYLEYGEIEYPRHKNESYTQYLTRLSIKEEEKLSKEMERIFSGLKSFSNTLGNSIKNMFYLGDSLKKTMKGIKPIQPISIKPIKPELEFPSINWSEIAETRLRPFNELAERLDTLINTSEQATEFMIEANRIQTSIAGEIKTSGDITTKFSKRNIILSIIVIIISALAFMIAAYSIVRDNNKGEAQKLIIQRNVDTLSTKLSDINANLINGNQSVSKVIGEVLIEIKESVKRENEYKNLLEKQSIIIEELRKSNNEQKKRIERLEAKIHDFDSANNSEKEKD